MKPDIAFIGGSGMEDSPLLEGASTLSIETPFGAPSGPIVVGEVQGHPCAFLSRHGAGHLLSPSTVPYRANIYALKTLGVRTIIAVSAVGSLRHTIRPLDIFVPDQIYDRTKRRLNTFFDGICVHVGFADPFCRVVSDVLYEAGKRLGLSVQAGGTYVCIEGPRFSTRAESNAYRHMGFDVIGMTAMPEAILAREAEMCYAMLATVTDYDVWHEEDVTPDIIISNVSKNVQNTQRIIDAIVPSLAQQAQPCQCNQALKDAIVTNRARIPEHEKDKLQLIIGRYIS